MVKESSIQVPPFRTPTAQLDIRGESSLDLKPRDQKVRILVVEDHELFRRFVASMLRQQPSFRVVGEVEDGLNAVRQAQTLRPELVLLDIGLPGLSGLEVARRIRELVPSVKIVFLTQESAPDVVEEAFGLGAQGYLIKSEATSELLEALKSVLQGSRFASRSLNGRGSQRLDLPMPIREFDED